jgi:nitroreductase
MAADRMDALEAAVDPTFCRRTQTARTGTLRHSNSHRRSMRRCAPRITVISSRGVAVLIRGDARQSTCPNLFVKRMQQREPPAPPGKVEKARTMPLSAPLVIAVAAHIRADHKVPEVEQLLSSGAATTMNLMNALHAQGYASIWLTGPNAYDPQIA